MSIQARVLPLGICAAVLSGCMATQPQRSTEATVTMPSALYGNEQSVWRSCERRTNKELAGRGRISVISEEEGIRRAQRDQAAAGAAALGTDVAVMAAQQVLARVAPNGYTLLEPIMSATIAASAADAGAHRPAGQQAAEAKFMRCVSEEQGRLNARRYRRRG